jgi:hypothetical protein
MTYAIPSRLLRVAFGLDAAASGALAIFQIAAGQAAAPKVGLSEGVLLGTGLLLAAYAVLLLMLARSAAVPRSLVILVAAGNVAWAVACLALVGTLRAELTQPGIGYLLFQAVATIGFATAQAVGLRQSSQARSIRQRLAQSTSPSISP